MTKPKDEKFEPKDRGSLCASEKESAAAWNGARERMTKLTVQYDKAKEAERFAKGEPTR
jgi:hypothetical protein